MSEHDEKYEAVKELTIEGKVIKPGQLIPNTVDPERIRRGLLAKPPSIRARRTVEAAPSPSAPKAEEKIEKKPAGK